MIKKNILGLFLIGLVFLFTCLCGNKICFATSNIFDSRNIEVIVDGESFYGIREEDKILIPVRKVFEKLNCLVLFGRYFDQTQKEILEVSVQNDICPISLEIGKQEFWSIDGIKKLNSPAVIIDDTCFVGVEFIDLTKEVFGASYQVKEKIIDIDARHTNIKTIQVTISKKPGQFKVVSDHFYQEIKSDSGKLKGIIAYCSPIVEPELNSAFVDKINKEYNRDLDEFIAQAQENISWEEESFYPQEYNRTFDVTYNKNNLLSIKVSDYLDAGGAHPNTALISKTFDFKNNEELSLNDVLVDGYEKRVYDEFEKYINTEYSDLQYDARKETLDSIAHEIKDVNFYLTDDALVLYFDVYQVAGYAMGYPQISLKYDFHKDLFKINFGR